MDETKKNTSDNGENFIDMELVDGVFKSKDAEKSQDSRLYAEIENEYGPPIVKTRVNQRFFAELLIKKYQLCFAGRKYFLFNGKFWRAVDDQKIQKLIFQLLSEYIQKHENKEMMSRITDNLARSINKAVQTLIFKDTFPKMSETLIPVKNGCLRYNIEIDKFLLDSFCPNQFVSSLLNVYYDPNASYAYFKKLLDELLDEDDQKLLQRYLGTALLPINLTQLFLLLQGVGGSSKSLVIRLVADILGDSRVFDMDIKSVTGDYALSGLDTQTLLIASESAGNALCSSGANFIKKAVGGDIIQNRIKFANDKRKLCGNYSLVIVTNEDTSFRYSGDGEEWKRRLLPIVFTKSHKKVIKNLGKKLLQEHSSGILNWLLEGAADVLKKDWHIPLTPAQELRRDRLIERSEPVRCFLNSHVIFSAGDNFTSYEALKLYSSVAKNCHLPILTKEAFFKQLSREMIKKYGKVNDNNIRRGNEGPCRGYINYKLK